MKYNKVCESDSNFIRLHYRNCFGRIWRHWVGDKAVCDTSLTYHAKWILDREMVRGTNPKRTMLDIWKKHKWMWNEV